MDFKSKLLNDAVEQMSSLPGIGKRSALRLVLHLLDQSEKEVKDFTQAFLSLKEHLNFCSKCFHITEQKMCEICRNPSRSEELICVVQDIRDLLAIESTQQFYGKYHVLGGVISPMDGIGPNDLKINELKERIIKRYDVEKYLLNGFYINDTLFPDDKEKDKYYAELVKTFLEEYKYFKIIQLRKNINIPRFTMKDPLKKINPLLNNVHIFNQYLDMDFYMIEIEIPFIKDINAYVASKKTKKILEFTHEK